jgi:hypothetical protein
MIPGVSNNSGTAPMQAIVTVSYDVENLLVERKATGATTIGTGNGGDSYSIAQNELIVMDTDVSRPGMIPKVFSSLTGLEYNARNGDAGLTKRMVPLGVALTRINFVSASGLAPTKITVVTNGLVPLRWTSEQVRSPMPGDLFCAYPPKTDPIQRDIQLKKVSENSSGSRYHGDILGDNRTPMLMKKFNGSEIEDLIVDALDMLFENPELHLQILPTAAQRSFSPVETVLYNVVLGMVADKLAGLTIAEQKEALKKAVRPFGSFMKTKRTQALRRQYLDVLADDARLKVKSREKVFRAMFVNYRIAIMTLLTSVVGRVVGNRNDGTVPVYLG